MPLLLTILSVLAAVAFLLLLQIGLLLILKTLQSVKRHMQQIAMGVRAIETQTTPLHSRAQALHAALSVAGDDASAAFAHVGSAARRVDEAGRYLAGRH